MAPATDSNNQDLATKKAKLDSNSNSVIGGVGKTANICLIIISYYNHTKSYFYSTLNWQLII